jgi:hypothetical protein
MRWKNIGSSTRNKGQNGKTPLVPSWLDDTGGGDFISNSPVNPQNSDGDDSAPDSQQTPQNPDGNEKQPDNNTAQPAQPDPKRFSEARSNFTRYINSDGSGGGNLRRAVSSYVRQTTGGSQNATKRLGAARSSTAKLLSVIGSFASSGISATARLLHLGDIIGKSARDAFLRIMDFVCPDGGRTDEGIVRNAFIEALSEMPDWENKQIETLTLPEFLAFTEIYMADVIEEKIVNDIGNKMFSLPKDIAAVENIQEQMKDFIKGAVSDAVSQLKIDIKNIDSSQTQSIVDSVYKTVFDIMSPSGRNRI